MTGSKQQAGSAFETLLKNSRGASNAQALQLFEQKRT
jgi:hypothetical protein